MDYSWTVTAAATAPNDIPVTVALARQQCRIPDESYDEMLAVMIKAAAHYVENAARLILCPQTIRVQWECFPCGDAFLNLPLGPARGSVTLEYVASNASDSTTFTALTDFQAWTDTIPPKLAPAARSIWPYTLPLAVPAVRATYAAGFASASVIPPALKNAVLMLVKANYESPDGFLKNGTLTIPPVIEQFIASESRRGYP